MAAFAGIPLDADIEVQAVDRELNLTTLRVDNLYRCRQDGNEFLIHFEAVSRYRPEVLDRQVDYVRAIIAKYKLPCRSYLLLLSEGGVPDRLPRFLESHYGDNNSRIRLRAVTAMENTCQPNAQNGPSGTPAMDRANGSQPSRVRRILAQTNRSR
jgi:hypothetical protein